MPAENRNASPSCAMLYIIPRLSRQLPAIVRGGFIAGAEEPFDKVSKTLSLQVELSLRVSAKSCRRTFRYCSSFGLPELEIPALASREARPPSSALSCSSTSRPLELPAVTRSQILSTASVISFE